MSPEGSLARGSSGLFQVLMGGESLPGTAEQSGVKTPSQCISRLRPRPCLYVVSPGCDPGRVSLLCSQAMTLDCDPRLCPRI